MTTLAGKTLFITGASVFPQQHGYNPTGTVGAVTYWTAKAITDAIGDLDSTVCYQSRVGPLKWIGPPTEQEIERAGRDGANVVLYPLSFVSEHSETLVELDMDYRQLASEAGVAKYVRVPTVGTHPRFIDGLARLVRNAL